MTSRHASCIAVGGHGILILGDSGAGKSDLALRLIDQPGEGTSGSMMKAQLVADDQVVLAIRDGRLTASPPPALAGLLEVRGQGIVQIDYVAPVPVRLVIELLASDEIERLPEAQDLVIDIEGIAVPRVAIDPATPSAPARVRSALVAVMNGAPG